MGAAGLTRATKIAILNANYVAKRLEAHYPVVYKGSAGRVAHECIVDARPLKKVAGIEVDDVAKRLMDYGFHAPTMSFPIPGTLMIEPTESESKAELDRFCDAMIAIREEISRDRARDRLTRGQPAQERAPHGGVSAGGRVAPPLPARAGRVSPALPADAKFWPPVGRLNNVLGDRKLFCTCPDISEYASSGRLLQPADLGITAAGSAAS